MQPLLAVFVIYPSRARYVIHDLIGTQPSAVVTTDRYASFAFLDVEQRQICWAHLLRDFNLDSSVDPSESSENVDLAHV